MFCTEDKKEIALSMLAERLDINLISKLTKLTVEEINNLVVLLLK